MADAKDRDGADIRTLVIVALFLESAGLLAMIGFNPALLNSAAFMLVVGFVIGNGGQGGVTSWLFGGTKTGSQVMESNAATIQAATPAQTATPATPVANKPPLPAPPLPPTII